MLIGKVDISKIKFDPKSRDDIPQILRGLQYIYTTLPVREAIFTLLEKHILPKVDKNNGRPGMDLWKIFVIGVLRLDLNLDYDRLHNEINNHKQIRQFLGHPDFSDEYYYHLQTIKDNVSLLTPELLDEINQVVVASGHVLLKKKENGALRGRCDSFVVETNVHFPTDINLLYDAMRKAIKLTAELCELSGLSDWRQYRYNIRHVKKLMRIAQNKKGAQTKKEEKKKLHDESIKQAHQEYIDVANHYLRKVNFTLELQEKQELKSLKDATLINDIRGFIHHAERQINQIERRVLHGEIIPHAEKVFSIFQPHTEWISKGKAGVPVELGVKVCVMEDQYQFILHYHVMEKQTDDEVAIFMVEETKKRFPDFRMCSFDKGFHSKKIQEELAKLLEQVVLPRKGKLSKEAKEIEGSKEFRQARHQHSAVESAINALEVHGLDKCPDHGIEGFKRYIALSVVARNIQRIGSILEQQEKEREERKKRKLKKFNVIKISA